MVLLGTGHGARRQGEAGNPGQRRQPYLQGSSFLWKIWWRDGAVGTAGYSRELQPVMEKEARGKRMENIGVRMGVLLWLDKPDTLPVPWQIYQGILLSARLTQAVGMTKYIMPRLLFHHHPVVGTHWTVWCHYLNSGWEADRWGTMEEGWVLVSCGPG